MGIGSHRIRTSPPDHELQELVDQLVADPIDRVHRRVGRDTRKTDSTSPHTSCSGMHPRRSPGCLSQEVDHLYNRRYGATVPHIEASLMSSTMVSGQLVRLRAKASCSAVSTARSQYPARTQLTASSGACPQRMARQAIAVPVRPWPP